MKKLLFLLPLLAIISCDRTDPDNPYDAQFNSNGCLECDNYTAGESFIVGGVSYEVADRTILETAIADGDDLTRYCTSRIGDMSYLFQGSGIPMGGSFNQDISSWDVSNVTNMQGMFSQAESFNQDIGNWDVSNVTDMSTMFNGVQAFNQDIGGWNVSNVTNMSEMFRASYFNQDISNWDVSNVTNMWLMFVYTYDFNQNISSWDVSSVTNMNSMFAEAATFNQDLTQWCVSNFTSMPANFSTNSGLTASNHPVWGTCP